MSEYLQIIKQMKTAAKNPMEEVVPLEEQRLPNPMEERVPVAESPVNPMEQAVPLEEVQLPTPEDSEDKILQEIEKDLSNKNIKEPKNITTDKAFQAIIDFMKYMGDKLDSLPKNIDEAFNLFINRYRLGDNEWHQFSNKEIKTSISKLKNMVLGEDKAIAPKTDPTNPNRRKLMGLLRETRIELLNDIERFWTNEAGIIQSKWKHPWKPTEKKDLIKDNFKVISKYFIGKAKGVPNLFNLANLTDENIQKLFVSIENDLSVQGDTSDTILEFLNQEPDPITARITEIFQEKKDPDMWTRVRTEDDPEEKQLKAIKPGQRKGLVESIKNKIKAYQNKVGDFNPENALEERDKFQKMTDVYMSYVLFHLINFVKKAKKTKKIKNINEIITKDLDPKNVFKQMNLGFSQEDVGFFMHHLDSQGYIPAIIDWMSDIIGGKWENNEHTKEMMQKGMSINNPGKSFDIFDEDDETELDILFHPLLAGIIQLLMKVDPDTEIPTGYKERKPREPKDLSEKKPRKKKEPKPVEPSTPTNEPVPPPGLIPTEMPNAPAGASSESLLSGLETPIDKDLAADLNPTTPVKERPKERLALTSLYKRLNDYFENLNFTDIITDDQIKNKVTRYLRMVFSNFYNNIQRNARSNKTSKRLQDMGVGSPTDLIQLYLFDTINKGTKESAEILSLFALIGTDLGLSEDFMQKLADMKEKK